MHLLLKQKFREIAQLWKQLKITNDWVLFYFSPTDVSNVGCHCNSAAYFIKMPGNNPGDGGDYYCDANFGNNIWCPEYDTWEGNKYTMAGIWTVNGGVFHQSEKT